MSCSLVSTKKVKIEIFLHFNLLKQLTLWQHFYFFFKLKWQVSFGDVYSF